MKGEKREVVPELDPEERDALEREEAELLQESQPQRREFTLTEKGDLAYLNDMAFIAERNRVRDEVRLEHLAKVHHTSPDTVELLRLHRQVEKFLDKRLSELAIQHCTWPWASRIKGLGGRTGRPEIFPKAIGKIEDFGKFYDVGDPRIPPHIVGRAPQLYYTIRHTPGGDVIDEKTGLWVAGIERLTMPSKLHKYAGLHVENGVAPKRQEGVKLGYNSELRMALFRVSTSLIFQGGIWAQGRDEPGYSRGYHLLKKHLEETYLARGIQIQSTPRVRVCTGCGQPCDMKKARRCPECGSKLSLKTEPPGVLWKQHFIMRVRRQMIKDWTTCLWLVWREALGLPITQPYGVTHLNHPPLDPWKMLDY